MVVPVCERVQSNWVGIAAVTGVTLAAAVAIGLLVKKGSAPIPRGEVSLMSRGTPVISEAELEAILAQLSPQDMETLDAAMEAFAKIEILGTLDEIKVATAEISSDWGVSEWTEWLESVGNNELHWSHGKLEAIYTHGEATVEEMAGVLTYSRSSELRQLLKGAHADLQSALPALTPKAKEAYQLATRFWKQECLKGPMLSASARVESVALGLAGEEAVELYNLYQDLSDFQTLMFGHPAMQRVMEPLPLKELGALLDPKGDPQMVQVLFEEGVSATDWDVGSWAEYLAQINADAAHPYHQVLERLRTRHKLGIGELAQAFSSTEPGTVTFARKLFYEEANAALARLSPQEYEAVAQHLLFE